MALRSFVFVSLAVTMLGCGNHSVQTTSGKSYLAKYEALGKTKSIERPESTSTAPGERATFEQALKHVADIEPTISFPARIGIAKIGCPTVTGGDVDYARIVKACGQVQPLFPEEVQAWTEMASNLGPSYGTIVPLSPLVIDEALSEAARIGADVASLSRVDRVRLGAARQHLDSIIIYETQQTSTEETNALAIGDLTLIGAFVLPSKRMEGQAYAAAIMIDPVTGYPYGQIEASAESDGRYSPRVGASAKKREVMLAAEANVVKVLAAETEMAIRNLRLALAEKDDELGD